MRQMVGAACGRCHQVIESVVDGRFCPECGNAVHNDCQAQVPDTSPASGCAACNGDLNSDLAREFAAAQAQRVHAAALKVSREKWSRVRLWIMGMNAAVLWIIVGCIVLYYGRPRVGSDAFVVAVGAVVAGALAIALLLLLALRRRR